MQLRQYQSSDCEELASLFYQTVHEVNARDYTKAQLNVWATGKVDLREWDKSFLEHYTVVAIDNDKVVGFGDIDYSGYLDRLFVHKDYQGKGIGTAICDELERFFDGRQITSHVSITAKEFFLHRGYHIIKQQEVVRNRIALTNYLMVKKLNCVHKNTI